MQADRQNNGVLEGHDQWVTSTQEERTWSVLSHLSMFLNLVTGLLGPLAALIIWLVYKDRSQKVAFHALQSMFYQIGWLVILAYAAYRVSQGEEYRYPFAADLVEGR